MEHELQISFKRYVLSMEEKMATWHEFLGTIGIRGKQPHKIAVISVRWKKKKRSQYRSVDKVFMKSKWDL